MSELTLWLKSSLTASSVRDLPVLSTFIHISVLSSYVPVRILRLNLEWSISGFIAVAIGSIVILLVDLLEDRYWCGGGSVVLGGDASHAGREDYRLKLRKGFVIMYIVWLHILPDVAITMFRQNRKDSQILEIHVKLLLKSTIGKYAGPNLAPCSTPVKIFSEWKLFL